MSQNANNNSAGDEQAANDLSGEDVKKSEAKAKSTRKRTTAEAAPAAKAAKKTAKASKAVGKTVVAKKTARKAAKKAPKVSNGQDGRAKPSSAAAAEKEVVNKKAAAKRTAAKKVATNNKASTQSARKVANKNAEQTAPSNLTPSVSLEGGVFFSQITSGGSVDAELAQSGSGFSVSGLPAGGSSAAPDAKGQASTKESKLDTREASSRGERPSTKTSAKAKSRVRDCRSDSDEMSSESRPGGTDQGSGAGMPSQAGSQGQQESGEDAAKKNSEEQISPNAQAAQPSESGERDHEAQSKVKKRRHDSRSEARSQDQRQGGSGAGGEGESNSSEGRRGRNRKRRRQKDQNSQQGRSGSLQEDGRKHAAAGDQNQARTKELGPPVETAGLLEIAPKGFGFLRRPESNYEQVRADVFVSPDIIRQYALRPAVWVEGVAREGNRGPQLVEIETINGNPANTAKGLPRFEELKAVNPTRRLSFETTQDRFTTRVLDLVAPIGRGQRGLLVAPPRSGKTTILQHIAEAIEEKYEEDLHLMVLLIDERPEEVTEFKRCLPEAEIFASSNDSKLQAHCRLAEIAIERAKRLVESGRHVFLLLDSITRLARAYNNNMKGKGRTMSGGIDARALEIPRRLFAAARNTREAGSLTIIATALVNTNSRMDDLVFQEFKGTGNMELVLDRHIAENYIYPAVDIFKSGTRREELLLAEHQLDKISLIRRGLAGHRPVEAMERLLFFLKKYHNNAQLLLDIKTQH